MTQMKITVPNLGFTLIENIFIDKHLANIRGEFVKVYLVCLRYGYAQMNLTLEEISSSLNLLQTDVVKALESLQDEELIRISQDGFIEILPLKSDTINTSTIPFDRTIKEMFEDIEKLVARPLSSKEVSTYLNFIEDFNFTPEIITLLVEYCSSRRKTDIRYIEKVAMGWHDSGIKNYEDAQTYITKHEGKWIKYREILTFLGMKDSDISKPQEEMLEKWVFKYNFPNDVILEACRICVMRINEANFSYIDAILNTWQKNGVKKLGDIKKSDKKTNKSSKKQVLHYFNNYSGQREYDIDELEKQLLGRGDVDEK
jgi:DnaD/phage-associated family protein